MTEYTNIPEAARHRDWRGCDRLVFGELYLLPFDGQRVVAADALHIYAAVWTGKHPDAPIEKWIAGLPGGQGMPLFAVSGKLDPADAEFENGLMQFSRAMTAQSRSERTARFATSIRSAVLARTINRWLHDRPAEYQAWSRGEHSTGPTFLEDEGALKEAEMAWKEIDELFRQSSSILTRSHELRPRGRPSDFERQRTAWETSLL